MRGRAIKLSNIDSPCYDKKTHTDCPNRRKDADKAARLGKYMRLSKMK